MSHDDSFYTEDMQARLDEQERKIRELEDALRRTITSVTKLAETL